MRWASIQASGRPGWPPPCRPRPELNAALTKEEEADE
jgi:hypothetical protein